MPDHVHMLLSIPPKYAVSQVIGFIKGNSAIHMATVGRDEEAIRAYIRNQEKEDQRLEQLNLWR